MWPISHIFALYLKANWREAYWILLVSRWFDYWFITIVLTNKCTCHKRKLKNLKGVGRLQIFIKLNESYSIFKSELANERKNFEIPREFFLTRTLSNLTKLVNISKNTIFIKEIRSSLYVWDSFLLKAYKYI